MKCFDSFYKGLFLNDIFEIADTLLSDKDDLGQKGYGRVWKAANESHLQEMVNYVIPKKDVLPRTTLHYAIEKRIQELRAEITFIKV